MARLPLKQNPCLVFINGHEGDLIDRSIYQIVPVWCDDDAVCLERHTNTSNMLDPPRSDSTLDATCVYRTSLVWLWLNVTQTRQTCWIHHAQTQHLMQHACIVPIIEILNAYCIYLSINLSIGLSIYLSIHLSIYPSVHLSIVWSIYLFIHPSIYRHLFLSNFLCKFLCMSLATTYLSIYPSTHPLIFTSLSFQM